MVFSVVCVCVYARDISYGTHTGNLHIKINCSDLQRNEIIIIKKQKQIYLCKTTCVFCLGADPHCARTKEQPLIRKHTHVTRGTAYGDMTNYSDD